MQAHKKKQVLNVHLKGAEVVGHFVNVVAAGTPGYTGSLGSLHSTADIQDIQACNAQKRKPFPSNIVT